METVGARLKKLRLEKGVSLEDISKKTKIHPDILKSLEEDSVANLNPVYLKGFIKNYCQFLGADPSEYLRATEESSAPRLPDTQQIREPRRSSPAAPAAAPVKFKILAVAAGLIGVLLVAVVLVNLVRFASVKISAAYRRHKEQAVVEKVKAAKKAPAPPQKKTPGPAAPQVKTAAVNPGSIPAGAVHVSIQAIEDCWVQAKVDGKTVFQNVLKRGRSESWAAKEKIELTLGSAGGIRLEVNGKLMPALGHKGQVIKNILITKEGLKVLK